MQTSPMRNLRPLIAQRPVPTASKAYWQLLRRYFNPLNQSPTTAYWQQHVKTVSQIPNHDRLVQGLMPGGVSNFFTSCGFLSGQMLLSAKQSTVFSYPRIVETSRKSITKKNGVHRNIAIRLFFMILFFTLQKLSYSFFTKTFGGAIL